MKLQHEKNSNLDMGPAYPSPSLWQDLNYTTCGLVDPANLTVCITCDCFKIRLLIAFGLDLKNDEVAKRTLLLSLKGFSNLFLLFPSHQRIMGEQEREVNFTCLTSDEQFSFFFCQATWERPGRVKRWRDRPTKILSGETDYWSAFYLLDWPADVNVYRANSCNWRKPDYQSPWLTTGR